jgi:protocatechuate 3,4-dioxygenase beta subunit
MVAAAALWTAIVVAQAIPASSSGTPTPATGLIVGRVADGSSGRPVAGAIVTVQGTGAPLSAVQPRAMTSAAGQFVFRKVARGSYRLTVTRVGYADGSYGQRRPGGSSLPLQLETGQREGDVVIPIWKHASISGTVVDEAGEPLVGVMMRAFQRRVAAGRPRLRLEGMAFTDDRGIYRFSSLMPGDYVVAFAWREASMPADVADLFRTNLNPADPKMSELMRERMVVGASLTTSGASNMIGVGGLLREIPVNAPVPPPGPEQGALFIYPTQFYPGVPSAARARTITLASGETRESVDFALSPVRTSRISGAVIGPEGPMANIAVRLVPASDDTLTEMETSVTMTGGGGEFSLLGVPAGDYVIKIVRTPRPPAPQNSPTTQIRVGSSMVVSSTGGVSAQPPPIPDDSTLAAEVPVAVTGSDVADVLVTLQHGARVTGRFEFDGNAERPDATALTRIPIVLDRADAVINTTAFTSTPPGRGDESGGFKTYGMAPGKYLIRVPNPPPGWSLRSIVSEGRDVSEVPLELRSADLANVTITFTDRPTKLTGTVRAGNGNADNDALVIVFPADASGWTDFGLSPRRIRSARPDTRGNYSIGDLPPGDYYITAIHEESVPLWQDPRVFEDLARAAAQVHLAEGDARVQDLKTSGGGR